MIYKKVTIALNTLMLLLLPLIGMYQHAYAAPANSLGYSYLYSFMGLGGMLASIPLIVFCLALEVFKINSEGILWLMIPLEVGLFIFAYITLIKSKLAALTSVLVTLAFTTVNYFMAPFLMFLSQQ